MTGLTFGPGSLLYGTTSAGGPARAGTVFSISPLGDKTDYTIIHSFQAKDAADGYVPHSRLISDGPSKFYGTTQGGGEFKDGTVYGLNLNDSGSWVEKILYSFQTGTSDLNSPSGSGDLVQGPKGVLYGTTQYGGLYNQGGIYQLTPPAAAGGQWQETVLHVVNVEKGDFASLATLFLQPCGQLLGTGYYGGGDMLYAQGGIFQMTPPAAAGEDWTYKNLYIFAESSPYGGNPSGALTRHGKYYAGVNGRAGTGTGGTPGTGTVYEFQLKTSP